MNPSYFSIIILRHFQKSLQLCEFVVDGVLADWRGCVGSAYLLHFLDFRADVIIVCWSASTSGSVVDSVQIRILSRW